ncbi:unnamed protein product [Boreogadus saida]
MRIDIYRDKNKTNQAWKEIGEEFGPPAGKDSVGVRGHPHTVGGHVVLQGPQHLQKAAGSIPGARPRRGLRGVSLEATSEGSKVVLRGQRPRGAAAGLTTRGTGFIKADTGSIKADTGFNKADTGFNKADTGFNKADTGFNKADTGFNKADTGFNKADTGFNKADTGFNKADTGFNQADTGSIKAATGFNQAATGFNQAATTYT